MTATTTTYRKEIVYDRETRDYAMYLDGELVGFARTHQEAETTLDQLVFELLNGTYVAPADAVATHRETAAETADMQADAATERELPATERAITLAGPRFTLDRDTLDRAYGIALTRPALQTDRWQRALQRGFDHLVADGVAGLQDGAYFWTPDNGVGGYYRVTPATCQCKAFAEGDPCKHRASAIILSYYEDAALELDEERSWPLAA